MKKDKMAGKIWLSKAGLAITLAIISIVGAVISGYFTYQTTKDVEYIKAQSAAELTKLQSNSAVELLKLQQNFDKFKKEFDLAEKDAMAKLAAKTQRCNDMRVLFNTMAQDLTSINEQDGVDFLQKINRARANAAKAQTFFTNIGDVSYSQGKKQKLSSSQDSIIFNLSVIGAAFRMEIQPCNVN